MSLRGQGVERARNGDRSGVPGLAEAFAGRGEWFLAGHIRLRKCLRRKDNRIDAARSWAAAENFAENSCRANPRLRRIRLQQQCRVMDSGLTLLDDARIIQ